MGSFRRAHNDPYSKTNMERRERENVGLEEKDNPRWKQSFSRFHVSFPACTIPG